MVWSTFGRIQQTVWSRRKTWPSTDILHERLKKYADKIEEWSRISEGNCTTFIRKHIKLLQQRWKNKKDGTEFSVQPLRVKDD